MITLDLPVGATLLHAGYQESRNEVSVWALVHTDNLDHTQVHEFIIVGTGTKLPPGWDHVGSVHVDDYYVYHVFQRIPVFKTPTGQYVGNCFICGLPRRECSC